jgi:putative oxidoreductase
MILLIVFVTRLLLVMLFFPFSALDKVLNFTAAVGQASQASTAAWFAKALILAGLTLEIFMSIAVLTGIADRLAAVVLAGYCVATALLWKQFWRTPDFRLKGPSQGRDVFWDFLKNLSVAGGFLVLAVGADGSGLTKLASHPFASTHPYRTTVLTVTQP